MRPREAVLKAVVYRAFSWAMALAMFTIGLGWMGVDSPLPLLGGLVAVVEVTKSALYLCFDMAWLRLRRVAKPDL